MSMFPQISVRATSIATLSSSVGAILPHIVTSKEPSEASVDELVQVKKKSIPIYVDTKWFIDKDT